MRVWLLGLFGRGWLITQSSLLPLSYYKISSGGGARAMGGLWSSSSSSSPSSEKRAGSEMALPNAKDIVASTPVVVFSKTFCPYCIRVKQLLAQLGASFKAIELDVESEGSEIQSALLQWTGQRTVPNVFIGGKHIGGCDTVTAKHNEGKLVPLLTEAGALATAAA